MSPSFLRRLSVTVAAVVAACVQSPEHDSSEDPPRAQPSEASVIAPAPSSEVDSDTEMPAGPEDAGPGDASRQPCTTSFAKDIVPAIAEAGCGSVACHGTRLGSDPRIEPKDPSFTYDAFAAYKLGGKPYVDRANPSASTISCHFHGKCGKKMPPRDGSIPAALVAAVDAWIACGAPKN